MKIKDLLKEWEGNASTPRTPKEYSLRLPIYDAAKVSALAELYPGRTEEQILTDLLSAALDEMQASFTYVAGKQIAAYDEEGDPIYEDAGLTPKFHAATERHVKRLKDEL